MNRPRLGMRAWSGLVLVFLALGGVRVAAADPLLGETSGRAGTDTLRTNLWVAEALINATLGDLLPYLPPAPAAIQLTAGSSEAAIGLVTTVATTNLRRAGYQVHLERSPAGTELPSVELRYRSGAMELKYLGSGRRLGLWQNWITRTMNFSVQYTVVDPADGRVLANPRFVRSFQDRVPPKYLSAIESLDYPAFTKGILQSGGWTRRLEEIVVLGTLAGLVAIYFANVE